MINLFSAAGQYLMEIVFSSPECLPTTVKIQLDHGGDVSSAKLWQIL
jgi:hypothetical protein